MTKREIGFTQGAGCAIRYCKHISGDDCARQLFETIGISLDDYRKYCDKSDYEVIENLNQ